ncbi:MAG: DNA/RNA non-specific endonuclease [Clostridia bacterium]|nr:DNA/RNA non-specific endonuclease [Clostridia bacterium]
MSLNKIVTSLIVLACVLVVTYFAEKFDFINFDSNDDAFGKTSYSNLVDVPDYSGEVCVMINDNKPYFSEDDYTTKVFENYSELDYLGRCGVAYANICKETMPPEGDERGDIGSVHPTGWKQAKFNGEYLYNRCHLIAYCLSDEDANKQNLITGTRYFNVEGMLPIEKLVLEYMNKNPNNHVLYRVTPVFKDENLLASGVEMEGYSIEDNGQLSFNVFIYNVQPGANLNYKTGELINQ